MLYHDFLKYKLLDFISSEILVKELNEKLKADSFNIEIPDNKEFGDVSTNIAMVFSKIIDMSPHVLGKKITEELKKNESIKKLEIVGPGFINIFFTDSFWQSQLKELMKKIDTYKYKIKKKKICIEFVSANPTGLMHIGHARGAVLGDTISSILEEVGHDVEKEYYINDAGEQIKKLIKTIIFHINNRTDNKFEMSDDFYPGDYLKEVAKKILEIHKDYSKDENLIEEKVLDLIMKDIKSDLFKIRVDHNSFVSEKQISVKENVNNITKKLEEKNLIYFGYQDKPKSISVEKWQQKKQLLFKSKKLGDDSDRALLKPDGQLTYFMSDIIYHQNKIDRHYDTLLNIWGIDHSGYVKRLKNALEELNKKKKFNFEIKLTSLVNLLEGDQIVKMSKREGKYVTLRDVVKIVGADVLRFMMISRNADKRIDFDFEIIKSKSKDNPVFYVQYAYVRCMSLIKIYNKTFDDDFNKINISNSNLFYLELDEEKVLIKKLCNYFNMIISSANNYEPHRVTNYLFDLARDFHAYWGLGKIDSSKKIILENNIDISKSRLVLAYAISQVIKKGLNILKIDCPEKM